MRRSTRLASGSGWVASPSATAFAAMTHMKTVAAISRATVACANGFRRDPATLRGQQREHDPVDGQPEQGRSRTPTVGTERGERGVSPTGQLALELGTAQAAERDAVWNTNARAVIELDWQGRTFTADQLTSWIGRPRGSGNAVGALFHQLAREGLIEAVGWTTSSRPERRGAAIRVWRAR
jgi:hypothetical protein